MRRAILIGIFLAAACQGQGTSTASGDNQGGTPNSPSSPGTGTGQGTGSNTAPSAAAPELRLTVRDPSGSVGPFALDDLEKLAIEVRYAHLKPGEHSIRLDVVGPDGLLYAQLPTTLTVKHQHTGNTTSDLQVRGTTIETYRQVGAWQIVASLDGTPVASASVDVSDAAR